MPSPPTSARARFTGVSHFVVTALVLVAMPGCSPPTAKTAPVSGLVTYGGGPVKHAMVIFFPQNVPNASFGFAQTDEAGRFIVRTFKEGDGAVIGHHFVAVTEFWPPGVVAPTLPDGTLKPPPRAAWSNKYRDSGSGALQVDVAADKENYFEFDLTK